MATILDGTAISGEVIAKVKARAAALAARGIRPGLAVVIVGEDPASQVYVRAKGRMAEECGFHSVTHELPSTTPEAELVALVRTLNADPAIHGILVQLPLPSPLRERAVIAEIDPDKDVDGLNVVNAGRLAAGETERAFVPCTPAGVMVMIGKALGEDLSGLDAVVIGRSNLVGKPVAQLLLQANATVTMAHSRTRNLAELCRRADIVVVAVGRPEMVRGDWIRPRATVIDVGVNRIPAPERGEGKTRLVGDVAFAEAEKVAGAITPVPGGVGKMTIAMLMANTVTAAERAAS